MMTRMLMALSLGFVGLIHATQTLYAQTDPLQAAAHCAPRPMVIGTLAQNYGETRRSIGLAANNTLMEVFASPETGTWTITATLPDGMTCLMASGHGFEPVAEELPAKGDPA